MLKHGGENQNLKKKKIQIVNAKIYAGNIPLLLFLFLFSATRENDEVLGKRAYDARNRCQSKKCGRQGSDSVSLALLLFFCSAKIISIISHSCHIYNYSVLIMHVIFKQLIFKGIRIQTALKIVRQRNFKVRGSGLRLSNELIYQHKLQVSQRRCYCLFQLSLDAFLSIGHLIKYLGLFKYVPFLFKLLSRLQLA